MTLYDVRRSGKRHPPYSVEVDLGQAINLAGAIVTFNLTSVYGTPQITSGTATPVDISSERGEDPLHVWRLEYAPTEQEVTVEASTDFVGWFTVVYAGAVDGDYPQGDVIRASINV